MPEQSELNQLPECDFCERTDSIRQIGDSYVCPDHINELNRESNKNRLNVNDVLRKSRDIDSHVQVSTDIFNAATTAIVDIERAIDEDETITNKPWAKAQALLDRFQHFKTVQIEFNRGIIEAVNNQKALQVRLNTLANTLREEEREKLRLSDLNYQPRALKIPVTAKTIKLSKQRIDNVALRRYSSELGIPEFSLRAIAIQKNLTADGVYKLMKDNLDKAKAASLITVTNSESIKTE